MYGHRKNSGQSIAEILCHSVVNIKSKVNCYDGNKIWSSGVLNFWPSLLKPFGLAYANKYC